MFLEGSLRESHLCFRSNDFGCSKKDGFRVDGSLVDGASVYPMILFPCMKDNLERLRPTLDLTDERGYSSDLVSSENITHAERSLGDGGSWERPWWTLAVWSGFLYLIIYYLPLFVVVVLK